MEQNFVLGIARTKSKVVTIRKAKPKWQEGKLNFIGGKVEPCEEPKSAMIREFGEETGIATCSADWTFHGIMQRQGNFKIFVFSSENERYEGCRTMETETVTVWDIQEFLQPQMITQCVENLHWLYHMVADGTDKIFTVDYLPVDYIDQLV